MPVQNCWKRSDKISLTKNLYKIWTVWPIIKRGKIRRFLICTINDTSWPTAFYISSNSHFRIFAFRILYVPCTVHQCIGAQNDRTVGVRNPRLHLSGSVAPYIMYNWGLTLGYVCCKRPFVLTVSDVVMVFTMRRYFITQYNSTSILKIWWEIFRTVNVAKCDGTVTRVRKLLLIPQ